ncbi:cytochrome c oxidase assembly protein [Streptomyces sp. TRM70350]|uniref:cytochrome c oxidase assembly protein n=1 Tax=Streptomyces sp. TRM70350 TaxID=2856165 RepID=UPI001C4970A6|nr:cytochrome c oxidase assembly protein [Streptomyces sp. TRM70350]MBV7698510.1 cytochrome c oxidase assembly protein [Streptomyces sp. TRM70350]
MTLAHVHPGPATGPGTGQLLTVVAALLVAVAYLLAAGRLRRRGDAWPRWRDVSFTAGGIGTAWASGDTVPGGPFTGHIIQHLVVGMAAPLLFVAARPLTLALRALRPGRARRRLLVLARSHPVGWLVLPPLAALLDVGGLWLLYRTELFAAMRHQPLLHGVVHAHMLATGLVFTFAVCQLDPVRRRWSVAVRGATKQRLTGAAGALGDRRQGASTATSAIGSTRWRRPPGTSGGPVVTPDRYQQHLKELAAKGQRGFIPAGLDITDPARSAEPRKL